jgi:cephalosporin hydroxylase
MQAEKATRRVRRALARRLDPEPRRTPSPAGGGASAPAAPAAPATRADTQTEAMRTALRRLRNGNASEPERAALEKLVVAWLDDQEASRSTTATTAIAGAFERLWQPRTQPVPLPPEPLLSVIRDQFHRLYYHASRTSWKDTWYRGVRAYKCPTDMWVYQELIDSIQPGLIIETGTFLGGSALFLADRLEIAGRGHVVTIDIDEHPGRPEHPRLTYLTGSSVDSEVLAQVRKLIDPEAPVLVILDSDHSQAHVAAELAAYAPLVTPGSYLIVEDTNVNGHPAVPDYGPGPFEAVADFLAVDDRFEVDARAERYHLTQNPSGFLRRRTSPAGVA